LLAYNSSKPVRFWAISCMVDEFNHRIIRRFIFPRPEALLTS
jgi:hypothetical protein